MKLFCNLVAVVFTVLILVTVTSLARGVTPYVVHDDTIVVDGLQRVLDCPTLRSRHLEQAPDGQQWIVLELEWRSWWRGGPIEIRGTLFLEHCDLPAGRVMSCRIDPSSLTCDPRIFVRVPMIPGDGSSEILCQADLQDLRVRFATIH